MENRKKEGGLTTKAMMTKHQSSIKKRGVTSALHKGVIHCSEDGNSEEGWLRERGRDKRERDEGCRRGREGHERDMR